MNWPKYIAPLFFLIFFVTGMSVVKDYGCSWDEDQQMRHGKVSAKAICVHLNLDCPNFYKDKNLPELQDYEQKYYGTFFQLVAIAIDTLFNRETFAEKIHTRHYLGFLLFFLSAICFYLLLKLRFNASLSLLGVIVYTTTPRIFAHSFFNPKDTIFLSFFVICLYALARTLKNTKHSHVLFLSISTALMLNARILGLILFITALLALLLYKKNPKKNLRWALLYLVETVASLILIWPLLWKNTFRNLIDSFTLFSKYPWKGELLYWGNYISSFELPWHYISSWILITTPFLFLVLILLGFALLTLYVLKNYKTWFENYHITLDGIVLAITLGPMIAIVVFQSVVYGGWRHMFFLHAGLVYMLVFTLQVFQSKFPSLKDTMLLVLSLGITWNIVNLVRLHPQQQVYFNPIVTEPLEQFEQDYWGVSTKQAMDKLLEIIPKDQPSRVFAYDFPAYCNYRMLKQTNGRLSFVWEQDKANYFIDNFRRKEHIEAYLKRRGPYANPIHIISSQGSPVVGIFKLDNQKEEK